MSDDWTWPASAAASIEAACVPQNRMHSQYHNSGLDENDAHIMNQFPRLTQSGCESIRFWQPESFWVAPILEEISEGLSVAFTFGNAASGGRTNPLIRTEDTSW